MRSPAGMVRERGPAYRTVTVVDASVVLKWVREESGSEAARRLAFESRQGHRSLIAPSLLWYEVFNVLCSKAQLNRGQMRATLDVLTESPVTTVSFAPPAFEFVTELARDRGLSAYDAAYVALSLYERTALVTADRKLCAACTGIGQVVPLEEFYRNGRA